MEGNEIELLRCILYELRCLNAANDRLLTNTETAKRLGVSRQTVCRYIKSGILRQSSMNGKKGILQSEINKMLYRS